MVKRWLITGGCGFLGTNLVSRLRKEGGYAVRIIDNLSVGTKDDLSAVSTFDEISSVHKMVAPTVNGPAQLVVGNISDVDMAFQITKGMDIIVHFAANTSIIPSVKNPRNDMNVNIIGTFNYLEAGRLNGIKKFIFASSGATIGECIPPIHEEMPNHPNSPYGASKLAGEGYCSAYFKSFGLNTVVLRFGNIYGPRSTHKGSVVAKFIKQALKGATIVIYGDGNQTRDFIYVDELVDVVVKASRSEVSGQVFQIATSRETRINEMVDILKHVLEKHGVPLHVEYQDKRAGEVIRNFFDTSKAKKLLDWESKVDLATGLKLTVRWFLDNN